MEIWINPACSKCRTATAALDEAGITYTVRRYLEDPPTAGELEDVLGLMGLEPWDIVRMTENPAAALKALPRDSGHRADWIAAMVADPILIQRPILTAADGTTVVGRDQESLSHVIADELS